jgi:hypothetical protein
VRARLQLLLVALVVAGTANAIPPNSRAVSGGVGWQCNPGYQRAGSTCRRIVATPQAGGGQSSSYACPPGYQRAGGQCRKIELPGNAYRSGADWACDAGYYRSGGSCRKLDTPVTVTAPPLVEECSGGYVLVDGVCKMDVPDRPRLDD